MPSNNNNNEDTNQEELKIYLTNSPASVGGDGPRNIEFEHDDFVEPIKVRLGDYVSKRSKEENNRYTLKPGHVEISTTMPDGKPSPIAPSESAEKSFYDSYQNTEDGQAALGQFDSESNQFDYRIAKGKDIDTTLPTIEDVVEDINLNRNESGLVESVQKSLNENNVYTSEKIFFDSSKVAELGSEAENELLAFTLQNKSGKHLPSKWPSNEEEPKNKITIQDLKNLGLQIMLEGSGEIKVPKPKNEKLNLAQMQGLVSTVPGLARLGLRVPVTKFLPGNIMEQVNPDYKKPGISPLDNEGSKLSHGNFNNPLVPFDSLNTTSNRIAAGILILAVSQMLRALGHVINSDKAFSALNKLRNIKIADPNNVQNSVPNLYDITEQRLGSANGESSYSNGIYRFRDPNHILFSRTYSQFSRAVDRGVALFFELGTNSDPTGLLNPLVRSFTSSNTNPGYYNVILRMLINDVNNVFSNVVPANLVVKRDETEVNNRNQLGSEPGEIALNTLDSVTNLLDVLRESRLLKFMDILAKIGDLSIMSDGDRRFKSIIDATIDTDDDLPLDFANNINVSSIVKKNRLSDNVKIGRGNLAWGSNKVPSMYMLPEAILNSEYNFKGERTLHRSLTKDRGFISTPTNRLSKEDVDKIESMLDSYYVPFYFQDLRTNEIIAFQAFLKNIADNYDVNNEQTEGIGRVETVYKYKNTKRSINVGFYVVSTNKQDFDEMWFKINKFVSLVYPQYTKGREVNSDNNYFIQPFSQLIGSSPMVRMRIGDLIKSNYSDFDIARLHGTSQNRFQLEGQTPAAPLTEQQKNEGELAITIRSNMMNGIFSVGQHFRLTQPYSSITANDNGIPNAIPLLPGPIAHRLSDGQGEFFPSNVSSNIGTTQNNRTYVEIPTNTLLRVVSARPVDRIYTVTSTTPVPGVKSGQLFNIQFLSNISDIAIIEEDVNRNLQLIVPENDFNSLQNEQSQNFFSPEQNPVFQSFDSVKGKGLAGFIGSLSLDYNIDQYVWETEGENNRAPKILAIDITFNPVHDISPGLDSDGFMIGMPYNVGEIMKTLKKQKNERNRATNTDSVNSQNISNVNGTE